LLAHDISEREQKFFRFDKPTEAVDFLTTQGEALHEVLNMPKTTASCTLILIPDTRFSSETMAMLLTALGSYLRDIKFDFVPIPGENCQLAQASTDVKHQSIAATCVS
jgi:hypothetical protein